MFFVFTIGLALALLLILIAPLFVTLFSRDPDLVSIGATWIRIQALSIVFLSAGQVFGQSFNTAGYTFAPMIVTLVSMWLIEIPLALVLTGVEHTINIFGEVITLPTVAHLGEFGIAWAIVFAMIARTLLFLPFYKSDRWLKVKLM